MTQNKYCKYPDIKQTSPYIKEEDFRCSDLVIHAQVPRSEIVMLVKLVEGLGHLGVVTTTDKEQGKVMIQTTTYCWPELKAALYQMPFNITIFDSE